MSTSAHLLKGGSRRGGNELAELGAVISFRERSGSPVARAVMQAFNLLQAAGSLDCLDSWIDRGGAFKRQRGSSPL
jgi:uncharacterized protein YidB (DUF937 family)